MGSEKQMYGNFLAVLDEVVGGHLTIDEAVARVERSDGKVYADVARQDLESALINITLNEMFPTYKTTVVQLPYDVVWDSTRQIVPAFLNDTLVGWALVHQWDGTPKRLDATFAIVDVDAVRALSSGAWYPNVYGTYRVSTSDELSTDTDHDTFTVSKIELSKRVYTVCPLRRTP